MVAEATGAPEGSVAGAAMATAAASEAPRRDSEAPRRDSEPTTVTVASQATLPPEQRTYGPLLVWGGAAKQTPYLLFRPLRFTLDELWDDAPRPVDCPWELSYQLARTESRLLRTLLHDHGFRPTSSQNYNLCWHNGHVARESSFSLYFVLPRMYLSTHEEHTCAHARRDTASPRCCAVFC